MRLLSFGRPVPSAPLRAGLLRTGMACLVVATAGCSVAAEDGTVESAGSTRVLLQIQRIDNGDGSSRGDALAGFVRQSTASEAGALDPVAGFQRELPEVGRCTAGTWGEQPRANPESLRLDLLDAESVQLLTSAGTHELAPHAFPTITDWVRGVVHASRDRDAANLPAGDTYRLLARNIQEAGSLDVSFPSPVMPSEVTIAGAAWAEAATLQNADAFVDFTWSAKGSDPRDRMVIMLETRGQSLQCTFNDSDGNGSVPVLTDGASAMPATGTPVRVSLHRVRELNAFGSKEVRVIAVRFDFSLATELTFE